MLLVIWRFCAHTVRRMARIAQRSASCPGGHRRRSNMSEQQSRDLAKSWQNDPRWAGITRPYTADDAFRLRGSVSIEHTLARMGAERLWTLLHSEPYIAALGAMTGNQAMQQV